MSSSTTWIAVSDRPTKRKRAELACEQCHSKKIKCDLLARSARQFDRCSNCAVADRECRGRPSQRANSGRRPNRPSKVANNTTTTTNTIAEQSDERPTNGGPGQIGNANDRHPALLTPPSLRPSTSDNARSRDQAQSALIRPISLAPDGSAHLSTPSANTRLTEARIEQSYHVDTGFLHVYGPENSSDARNQAQLSAQNSITAGQVPDLDLQQSFLETYLSYCYTWCPVIDRATISYESAMSPMLTNALALVGAHLQPPALPHEKPEMYYNRARRSFYEDEESDSMIALKALSLFYWWSPRPPSTVHRHSSWWWQTVIVRHCQQMGLHREPGPEHSVRMDLDLSIRRRIWWTAFARERLTAICQSRPCIIDPDDCNVQPLTLDDFSETERPQGEVFIHWVRLCAIIGKIAKHISRSQQSSTSFPTHLARELISWIDSLPPHLRLPIHSRRTEDFNRDVHQLHLPYLAVVIILHLKKSSQPLPQAYPPAILAATCMARIFRDILARGRATYLMAITCWYTGTAFMALQQACRVEEFSACANEDLNILVIMIDQLRAMWPTADIFHRGFQRLRSGRPQQMASDETAHEPPRPPRSDTGNSAEGYDGGGIEWTSYFPFASTQTSNFAAKLLAPDPVLDDLLAQDMFPDGVVDLDFGHFFEPFDNFNELAMFQ